MWLIVVGFLLLLAAIVEMIRQPNTQHEWQILRRNAQADHLHRGRWWRALRMRMLGRK